jgi:cytochrome P450
MSFLHAVILEALRLYPPIPCLYRKPIADGPFGDTKVSRKTVLLVGIYSINRDCKYWDDSDEFRPERWESSEMRTADKKFTYMTFSQGPRVCIGKQFAVTSLKCMLAALIWRFAFEEIIPGEHPKAMKGVLQLKPQQGFKIHVTRVDTP